MSKSLGNSPDPLELIDKYGADGLRFGLMRIAPTGQDIRFEEKQIEEGRNFATKLWNVARFRQMHGASEAAPKIDKQALSIYAVEVLARLNETIDAIEAAYREYHFNTVAQRLYEFVWSDYCDWFVEAAKTDIFGEDEGKKNSALAVMDFALSAILRLLHPFMPHITEELWSLLGFGKNSIQFAPPPEKLPLDNVDLINIRRKVAALYDGVQVGRNLRAEAGIPSNTKSDFPIKPTISGVEQEIPTLSRLLGAETVETVQLEWPVGTIVGVSQMGGIGIRVASRDPDAERRRLDNEIAKINNQVRTVEDKLKNKSFVDRAPPAVVEEHRRRLTDLTAQLTKLSQARKALD
jgi:valyl-tRNA synthetase